jgi:hypothetical protein
MDSIASQDTKLMIFIENTNFTTSYIPSIPKNLLKTNFLRYAKRFCPIPACFPSGDRYPKKPVETVSDGWQTAKRMIRMPKDVDDFEEVRY